MTFLAASLVMYSKYNEDLKQSVRDSTKYIQDSVEKMGESYLDKDLGKASAARITLLPITATVRNLFRQKKKAMRRLCVIQRHFQSRIFTVR